MLLRRLLSGLALLCLTFLVACGNGDDGDDSTSAPTTASGSATAPANGTVTAGSTPDPSAAVATPDPTEQALAAVLGDLSRLLIAQTDVPQGFVLRSSQPVTKRQAALANIAIGKLAEHIEASDLEGAWVNFFLRGDSLSGIGSVVYRYPSATGPNALVDTIASLKTEDYATAQSVERAQAPVTGERSQLMIYKTATSVTMEYTWVQGRYAGQITLRGAGDTTTDADVSTLVALAAVQASRIAASPR